LAGETQRPNFNDRPGLCRDRNTSISAAANIAAVVRFVHELNGLSRVLDAYPFARYLGGACRNAPKIISSKTLYAADRAMQGPVSFKTWGKRVELNCSSLDRELAFDASSAFGLARELYARDVYLRAFRPFGDSGTVIDLGGNRGLFTILAAAALSPDRIVYVEPDERYLEVMQRLTSAYPGVEVSAFRGFAGAAPADASAPVLDLEPIVDGNTIGFLKLDIEGAEQALFENAGDWLDHVDRIAMESHPQWCRVDVVVETLSRRGFCVFPADAIGRAADPAAAEFVYAARRPDALRPRFRA
jgi:hypothetical protein